MLLCVAYNTTASYLCIAKQSRDYYVRTVYIVLIITNYIECPLFKSVIGKYLEMLIRCQDRRKGKLNGHKTPLNLSINSLNNNRRILTRQYWELPKCTTNSISNWRNLSSKSRKNYLSPWIIALLKRNHYYSK